MFMVGNVSEKAQDLCRITKHSLDEAIKICGPGVAVREVGKVSITAAASCGETLSIWVLQCKQSVSMDLYVTRR